MEQTDLARLYKAVERLPAPYFDDGGGRVIYHGDCRELLPLLSGYDSVVTDPPYAEIDRDYGRMSEADWHQLMRDVVTSVRGGLSATGSAVFILQANSEKVGRMRPWLWEFMAWTAREWNQVQDAWWWNHATPPTVHCHEKNGLMRPSIKACVWLGSPDCYRDQTAALLPIAEATMSDSRIDRHELGYSTSGLSMRHGRALNRCKERGGATPFNVIVCANSDAFNSAGSKGHGAGTPIKVAEWWIRYITPESGIMVEPFLGSGTMIEAAQKQCVMAIGIEKEERYCDIAANRLAQKVLF